jgi:hypothetical protein
MPGAQPGIFYWNLIIVRSIKANPSKGGDAKPWIYNHASRGHDSQAANVTHTGV